LKKNYFSSHKLPKQQSTSFWSQGILGVKYVISSFPFITPCHKYTSSHQTVESKILLNLLKLTLNLVEIFALIFHELPSNFA
jgi:hypothetical protein